MGFAKKGSRKIVVNDQQYLWRISQKRPYFSEFGYRPMFVAIQLDAKVGSKLIVDTNLAPPMNYAHDGDPRSVFRAITPNDVRAFILKALEEGWEPGEKGKPFELKVDLKNEEK